MLRLDLLPLQLALNYTAAAVAVAANSTTVYTNSNASDPVYASHQLSRLIGMHDLKPAHAARTNHLDAVTATAYNSHVHVVNVLPRKHFCLTGHYCYAINL